MRTATELLMAPTANSPAVEWRIEAGHTDYATAVAFMENRVEAIAAGRASELLWFVEHPPLYTAGTSAKAEDLLESRFPVHPSGRGGQFTYHGPGQRVVYVMLDLERRRKDLRVFVSALEDWLIGTLATFNIRAERRQDRVGVWVGRPDKPKGMLGDMAEDKIAAIGIRVRRWVTYHGLSINVEPDLGHFAGIVPCGVQDRHFGVTSLVDLGLPVGLQECDEALLHTFPEVFGGTLTKATD